MGYIELQRMKSNLTHLADRYLELLKIVERIRAEGMDDIADQIVQYMHAKKDLKKLIREVQEALPE